MKFDPHVLSTHFGEAGFTAQAIYNLRDDHEEASCGLLSAESVFGAYATIRITNQIARADVDAEEQS